MFSFFLKAITYKLKARSGQSLIEIIVGLAIGAVLIGAAVVGITFVLRSGSLNQQSRTASGVSRALLQEVRSVSDSSWLDVYNLDRGISHYIVASGTSLSAFEGKEGVVVNAPQDELQAHWNFDESVENIVHNSVASGVRGDIIGTMPVFSCRVGTCRSFEGSQYMFFGDDSSLDLQADFSVALWMYPDAVPVSNVGLVSKEGSPYGYGITYDYDVDGQVRFFVRDEGSSVQAPMPPQGWHHVVGVFGSSPSSFLNLYVDGLLAATSTLGFSASGASGDFFVGRHSSGFFDGMIDDVRVYSRAFDANDVWSLYNGRVFVRSFYVEDVFRDSVGEIVSSGGSLDPSTLKVTIVVEWNPVGSAAARHEVEDYFTRWRNDVFHQSDWSEGPESLVPIPEPGGGFSNSSNIRFSPGSIQIDELNE